MKKVSIITPEEAALKVQDGDTIATGGFVSCACPETLSKALEKRFLETGHPQNLTLFFAAGQGHRDGTGGDHYGHEGMVKRVIGGHWDRAPKLGELLEKLLTAQPNVQFRLGSLDPRAVDDAFCERLAGFANLAQHFHLSMQSGCDTVLRRMNRHYTSEEFYRCVERLRRAFPDCSVTTDLIVGFPGETEDEFTQTLAFLERCAFASVHVFPYSVREGTKAAAMPGQLDQQTKTARAERAKQVAETSSIVYRKQFVGRTLYALPEHPTGGLWAAHGRYGFPVYIEDKAEKNHPVTVKVIGLHKDGVLAKIEN